MTEEGVKNLKIYIRKGINNIFTDNAVEINTESDGSYETPNLDAGNYCLEIEDETGEYISTYFNIKVFGGMTFDNQNMNISDCLEKNQMRVVLSWGQKPLDLDAHLLYNLSDSTSGHIYYNNVSAQ